MISPNSQGGPNIALITIACGWTFVGIASLGVSSLIWRVKRVGFGLDDCLVFLAFATTIALVAQTTWAVAAEGQDDHEAEVKRTEFALVVRSLLIDQTLWGVVNTLIRMNSILLIDKVLMVTPIRKWITRLLLLLSILYGLVVFLEVFLICRPMAVDWNANIDGTCGNQTISYLVLEIFGLLLDVIILAVPLPLIWELTIPPRRKVGILIVFSIGVLVFIVTGLRFQALRMVNAQDFTYSKGYLGLLSTVGASLGIIVCCAPFVYSAYSLLRERFTKRKSRDAQIDAETGATGFEAPNEIRLPRPIIRML